MTPSDEHTLLLPPMKTPRGWYVVVQPDDPVPNVFNLHERGLFTERPHVRKDYGARIVAGEDLRVAVQYRVLAEESGEASGRRYSWVVRHGLVSLTKKLEPNKSELKAKGLEPRVEEEIQRVVNEWTSSFPADALKGEMEEVKRSLRLAVEKGKELHRGWLVRSNLPWIQPVLFRMIQTVRTGLLPRVGDVLMDDYRRRGGEASEKELIRKINLFARIYESEGLVKPNGVPWLSEDELWDCWVAFSGSESEAKRTCATIESVLLPLRDEIAAELEEAA